MQDNRLVGTPQPRVDGRAKVTGAALYAADFTAPDGLLHGHVLGSGIARGTIRRIDAAAARAVPGVVEVFTHENRPSGARFGKAYQDQAGPPGTPLRPLHDAKILFSGQPVALVVAESHEAARHAANLIEVAYDEEAFHTDLQERRSTAYEPLRKRSGINPPPKPRGQSASALAAAPVRHAGEYTLPSEFHHPMEPHATTVVFQGRGKLLVHDKIQGVTNTQEYVCAVFGLKKDDVRVVAPYLGGGFGSGLRPKHQLFLAVMAALALERSVKVVLTRDQMFGIGHRPETINEVELGAQPDGTLVGIRHKSIGATSTYEDHQEAVVNWTGLLYECDAVTLEQELVQLSIDSPTDMRAPGAPTGMFAAESAMDELATKLGIDPIRLRLANYTEHDVNESKRLTSKELRAAFQLGAERFGWARRNPAPRSMCEGRELIGWGMASGAWEAQMQKHQARVMLDASGQATVGIATADLGTGTYTILTQIAAEALGLPMGRVTTLLGDTSLPYAPLSGGSWTAASAGAAVADACATLKGELLRHAQRTANSPLLGLGLDSVAFRAGRIEKLGAPDRGMTLAEVFAIAGRERLVADGKAGPSLATGLRYTSHTHAAVFVEARVDEALGQVRITRVVSAVAAGRILNPRTARSQIIGGVVWGLGMALHEEGMTDHALGRVMNHNLAEYHIPVHADVRDIDVIFVEERDKLTSPLGVKGLGEIGIVGTAAAVANAVWHATGERVRRLPITIDKVLGKGMN